MKVAVIDRFWYRSGAALVGLAALLQLGACFVDVDLGGSRLTCSDGQCPDGFECVDERCVPEGPSGGATDDDAGGLADAAPADAADDPDGDPGEEDAAVPDAGRPDAPPRPTACDEQYGDAPGYVLCEETPESCEFFLNSEVPDTCAVHCKAIGGGACIDARNDVPDDVCALGGEEYGCEGGAMNNGQVCTCALVGGFE